MQQIKLAQRLGPPIAEAVERPAPAAGRRSAPPSSRPVAGWRQSGPISRQRQQDEGALGHARMRQQRRLRPGAHQPAIGQQDRDRAPAARWDRAMPRPKSASTSCSRASSAAGSSAVSTSATPLTYQGWSETGTGALSHQRERAPDRKPARRQRRHRRLQGGDRADQARGLGRLAPKPIRIGAADTASTGPCFYARSPHCST